MVEQRAARGERGKNSYAVIKLAISELFSKKPHAKIVDEHELKGLPVAVALTPEFDLDPKEASRCSIK